MGQAGPVMGSFLEQLSPQQSVCFSESAFPSPLATCCLAKELHTLVVWLQASDGWTGYGSLLKKKCVKRFLEKREDIELTQAGEEEEAANAGKWGREETFGGYSQGWQLQVTNIINTRCNFLGLEIHILCSFGSSLRYNAALFGTSLHNHSADDTVSKPSLY